MRCSTHRIVLSSIIAIIFCHYISPVRACEPSQIPGCDGTGCYPDWWMGDGWCDAALNCEMYDFDGGDCGIPGECMPGDIPGCDGVTCYPDYWVGDGICDSGLNCTEFGYDGGDCGDPLCMEIECADDEYCVEGVCLACSEACIGKECGTDLCGESCGKCHEGFQCSSDGLCEPQAMCSAIATLQCGDHVSGDTNDGQNEVDEGCGFWGLTGPELAYKFTPTEDDQVLIYLQTDANLAFAVLEGLCIGDLCVIYGMPGDQAVLTVSAGITYYIVVDGVDDASGTFDLDLACASSCVPDCAGKECGWDGCFENCGECPAGLVCTDGGTCTEPFGCSNAIPLACGDLVEGNTTGSASELDGYSCSSWDESGPEMVYSFVSDEGQDVTFQLDDLLVDLDIFVLEGVCDVTNCIDYGSTSTEVTATPGETYYVVVDGYNGTSGAYSLEVQCQEPCVPACEGKLCGDDGCGGTCGTCPPGQICTTAGLCESPTPECTADGTVSCGDVISANNADGTNAFESYSCSSWTESGPELIYEFSTDAAGTVELSLNDGPEDLDLFISEGVCSSECFGYASYNMVFQAEAGQLYYIFVDGYYGDSGPFTLEVDCCIGSCEGKDCGDDGCGADCGECADGLICSETGLCINPPVCAVVDTITCGETISGHTTGLPAILDDYPCTSTDLSGPEMAYELTVEEEVEVHVYLSHDDGYDLDLVVTQSACTAPACIEFDGYEEWFDAEPEESYFLIVEGDSGDEGDFTLSVICTVNCNPDCSGKECGDDGCDGSCGNCLYGECVDGWCEEFASGCAATYLPGCGGCGCEDCVCALDAFCCENYWDDLCVSICATECGGCGSICGDGSCAAPEDCLSCPEDCACAEGEVCVDGGCCLPDCDGQVCGSDGCGWTCGECAEGETCLAGSCLVGNGCWLLMEPGCGGCPCEECVCAAMPSCCEDTWDALCAETCAGDCGGCGEGDCGDGECQPDVGEDCGTCPMDCPCPDGEVCVAGSCCKPDCDGKECGADSCGGSCGACPDGSCLGFQCYTGQGCSPVGAPNCGGCSCEACVCSLDPLCCQEAWDESCVLSCVLFCGGCGEPLEACGDGYCDPDAGESCVNCPDDCNCGANLVCTAIGCTPDYCIENLGTEGCCDGNVLHSCVDGILQSADCTIQGLQCGWMTLDGGGAYLCGKPGQVVPEGDSSGDHPPTCPDVCLPDCGGKECGSDGCAGSCGDCLGDAVCVDGLCCEIPCAGMCCGEEEVCFSDECCPPDCDGKECGDDGCGDTCGVCPGDEVCVDGLCCATPCAATCCNAGNVCFAGSCCQPDCSGKQCGDDDCGGSCGDCAPGFGCGEEGICVCQPNCESKECGSDGCLGFCGSCDPGFECVDGLCACAPDCEGVECGGDGCGGSCGTCPLAAPFCNEDGFCVVECVPNCDGKECGVDGCEGSCGTCPAIAPICNDYGICETECFPDCAGKECGVDGCKGSCGTCPDAAPVCEDGLCRPDCDPNCKGKECGDDGCGGSCGLCPTDEPICEEGVCIPDCSPNCDDKECGDDGCGGSCGTCPTIAPICNDDGICEIECIPDCAEKECGDDGCEGSCGTCPVAAPVCSEAGNCQTPPPDTLGPDEPDIVGPTPDVSDEPEEDIQDTIVTNTVTKGCTTSETAQGGAVPLLLLLVALLIALRLPRRAWLVAPLTALLLLAACEQTSTVTTQSGKDTPESPDTASSEDAQPNDLILEDTTRGDLVPVDLSPKDLSPEIPGDVPSDLDVDSSGPGDVVSDTEPDGLDECPEGCTAPASLCAYPLPDTDVSWISVCSVPCNPINLGAECKDLAGEGSCCGFALDDNGVPGDYCIPPEGVCEPCGGLMCPIETHQCVEEVGVCGPINQTWCGGVWCLPDEICAAPGQCCPKDAPVPCGMTCCEPGQTCIPEESLCICGGCTWCDGKSCTPGYVCVDGTCCPEVAPIPCGDTCCPNGTTCASECDFCLYPGQSLCDECETCDPGTECMVKGGCMPFGADECVPNHPEDYCDPGLVCVTDDPWCCPTDQPQVCVGICCSAEAQCIHDPLASDTGICICSDCEWCGGGFWCPANQVCLSYCPDADPDKDTGACCMPLGANDCEDGTWCSPGNVCVGFGKGCCPAATPQLCGDLCCPEDYQCIEFGEACICWGCTWCGDGVICDPGLTCMESAPDCMPVGSEDCGDGEFCEPGWACTETGTMTCCPNDTKVGCGDVCCSEYDGCVEEESLCVPPGWTHCGGDLLCGPGLECMESALKCMPQGSQDCEDGTYCNVGFLCTDNLDAPVEAPLEGGCEPSLTPGCDGCACESCVCSVSPYCCDVKWDSVCVALCADYCGTPCEDLCSPDCDGKQCGSDGCGGSCGWCFDGQTCDEGTCKENDSGCVATLLAGCAGCPCEDCVCAASPECCTSLGWWGGGWTGECVEECAACGGCGACTPDCADRVCGPDGCGGTCGDCPVGEICDPDNGQCITCIPDCEDIVCGGDGCGGTCGECGPGHVCEEGQCVESVAGTGKCCPAAAPVGCNKTCCPAGNICIPTDGDGLCMPPGAEYCGDAHFCPSGETCMSTCQDCMPVGAEECGECAWCQPGEVCADQGTGACCPAETPDLCGEICCSSAQDCVADGGYLGTGLCVPPSADICWGDDNHHTYYCESGEDCHDSCNIWGRCIPDGACDNGCLGTTSKHCDPGYVCHGQDSYMKCCPNDSPDECNHYCCEPSDNCYWDGGMSGNGTCAPVGSTVCKSGKYYCTGGEQCMTSCDACMPPGTCDNGDCYYCPAGSVCHGMDSYVKCCWDSSPQECNHYCCDSNETCYWNGGSSGVGMCVPPGHAVCQNNTFWCSSSTSKCCHDYCIPSGGACCSGGHWCSAGNQCCHDFCMPPGATCCSGGYWCGAGKDCCYGVCCVAGTHCCGNQQCCWD